MRALLLQSPDITLPEAARALNANERNCKSVRVAYWQARALLMEELTGKTLRAILDEGPIQGGHEGPFCSEGHMTYEGHMDHTDNEGPNIDVPLEDIDQVFGTYDISDF